MLKNKNIESITIFDVTDHLLMKRLNKALKRKK